jgi:cytochrome c
MILLASCGKKKEQDFYGPKKQMTETTHTRGEAIYMDLCVTCHLPSGEGVPKAFPPLAGSDYLKNNQEASIRAVKYGMSGEIVVNGETYNSVMTSMGLSDQEVSDVMNYINNAWGNDYGEILSAEKVTKITP